MKVFRAFFLGIAACFFGANLLSDVVINEIHYDPPFKTDLAEFIELHNTGPGAVDLSGWRVADGVEFVIPNGTSLASGGYLVLAENPAGFTRRFPGRTALGAWAGLLANDGQMVTLRDAANRVVDRVEYQLGFPWPTVGDLPGYSMELINPAFDNDQGGSWRRSVKGNPTSSSTTFFQAGTQWRYWKGLSEASTPSSAWRDAAFGDLEWLVGTTPIGYDPSIAMRTVLSDMRGSYTSVYLRKKFNVADPAAIGQLRLEALYDDGFKAWINGRLVVTANLPSREVAYHETTAGSINETGTYDPFIIAQPSTVLRAGENIIAIQLHNVSRADSTDCYFDARLVGELGSASAGPTPGARNAAYETNAPPNIRQVEHAPGQPASGQEVRISAKITDAEGVGSVQLLYQLVSPGSYIELNDAAYETSWTSLPMRDDATGGDLRAEDEIFTAVLPGSLQVHRRLVRYRIVASDTTGSSVRAPYLDDPQPNFAYFVYDGVPGWQGAARPGVTAVQSFSPEEMNRLPSYHLIAKRTSVEDATWNSKYTGDLYRWWGTLVYDGKVYDHIRYRARGGVWRYAMGKNMWKFDFNRGHDFEARDNFGQRYATKWRKLNLGANIQQGDYQHRGEQGMFESVGFRLFNLAGVESPKTHWATLRVIDDGAEAPATQYNGDLWGLYLGIEQEDGRFLDEHDLPDGNLYKMENYNGDLNNQGRTAATDKSDINAFTSGFRNSTPTEAWWRANFDLERYYSYQAIVQGIHHYDICYGKNYFYYLNPETRKWSVHTWDLDLTWADNMYDAGCGAADEFKMRVTNRAPFSTEYKNRVRELRDLLFNTDQAWKVIDEHALIVKGTNAGPNILAADRAMWDFHPVMANSAIVNPSKSGQGRFYLFPLESANNPALRGSFEAGIQIMKNYVVRRATVLDGLAVDNAIPSRPTITYEGAPNYPVNRVAFGSSSFSGTSGFAAMEWRVGEVRDPAPGVRAIYEIEPLWESGEMGAFEPTISVPSDVLRVGHTYRARVRMKDAGGRWSRWSEPVEFMASEPDNSAALVENLRISEIMYNPPAGNDFEYVELHNRSSSITLQLAGVTFTEGIDFTFPAGAELAPGEYGLVIRGAAGSFRTQYGLADNNKFFGPYSGALNNDGESVTLKTATAGAVIASISFRDQAGWPVAADGTGHSIVSLGEGNLDYPGNWRASASLGGSPGGIDPTPAPGVTINEAAAHTDYSDPARPEYDSNDWIELYNTGPEVSLGDYYLSDEAGNLAKWRLPNSVLVQDGRITFDEVTHFHNPITSGFGLNKAGEEIYLAFLPAGGPGRVVDAIRFDGQENDASWGRYPDGGTYFYTLTPTRNLPNGLSPLTVIISEIMYSPGTTNIAEEAWQEYIEVQNPSDISVGLANTNGGFRLSGGIAYVFPAGVTVAPGGSLVIVSFDPANTVERSRFTSFHGIESSNVAMAGPFTGRLANDTDRITLEKPEAPDAPGEPLVWVVVDEAIYTDASGADHSGESLTRVDWLRTANDPANLRPAPPTPGWIANVSGALQVSAARTATGLRLSFQAAAGQSYTVQYRAKIDVGGWITLREVTNITGPVEVEDEPGAATRYYRVLVQ